MMRRRRRVLRDDYWSTRSCLSTCKTMSLYSIITDVSGLWRTYSSASSLGTTRLSTYGRMCICIYKYVYICTILLLSARVSPICVKLMFDLNLSFLIVFSIRHLGGFLIFVGLTVVSAMGTMELGGLIGGFFRWRCRTWLSFPRLSVSFLGILNAMNLYKILHKFLFRFRWFGRWIWLFRFSWDKNSRGQVSWPLMMMMTKSDVNVSDSNLFPVSLSFSFCF